MLMSAKAFLDQEENGELDNVKNAISGNLCRCTGYVKILEAIKMVASDYSSPGSFERGEK